MITRQVGFHLTAQELAAEFMDLDSRGQALFFSALGTASFSWAMQLQYVSDEAALTEAGRSIMETIGEYSRNRSATVRT